jgi:hypothetical protein
MPTDTERENQIKILEHLTKIHKLFTDKKLSDLDVRLKAIPLRREIPIEIRGANRISLEEILETIISCNDPPNPRENKELLKQIGLLAQKVKPSKDEET